MLSAIKEIFEKFVFDPSLIDLVLWFPHLSWSDFAMSTATVVAWRFLSEKVESYMSFHIRRVCATGLYRLAAIVEPNATVVTTTPGKASFRGTSRGIARAMSKRWTA